MQRETDRPAPEDRGESPVDQPARLEPGEAQSEAPAGRWTSPYAVIATSRGWRRRGIAFGAGSLSVLAMAPFHFWPVLFLTLPVAIALLDSPQLLARRDNRMAVLSNWLPWPLNAAARDGWWFGFGYFFFGLFWIGEAFLVEAHIFGWLLPVAITAMPAGLALFTALGFALGRVFWANGAVRVIFFALGLALSEYLRGHILTGFPWNVLGYALTGDILLMQSAGLFGIYGLTLLTVLICTTPVVVLLWQQPGYLPSDRNGRRIPVHFCTWRPILLASVLPLVGLYAYGYAVLPAGPVPTLEDVKVRIVQPSVPQKDKWARDKQAQIFNDHLALTLTNEAGENDGASGITHVVWPEAAMPFLPLATPRALEAIGRTLPDGVHLIAGALRLEKSEIGDEVRPGVQARSEIYNSILVFGSDGKLVTLYDKLHLVPFGEYLPFSETLEAIGLEALTRIRGGFSIGPSPRPLLRVPGLPPIGPLICYEAIFPAAVVQTSERPGLLVNVTNDGWFGRWTGPYQHFHQSRIRAVEEGLPLVRVGNNGISALFDPYGRVLAELELDARGVRDVGIPNAGFRPIYSTLGEICFFATMFLFALAARAAIAYPLVPERKKDFH